MGVRLLGVRDSMRTVGVGAVRPGRQCVAISVRGSGGVRYRRRSEKVVEWVVELAADRVRSWTEKSVPDGITLDRLYFGPDPLGIGPFQVAVATATTTPTRASLKALFTARNRNRPLPLVVAVEVGAQVYLFGPNGDANMIELDAGSARRQLQSVLAEGHQLSAGRRYADFLKAHESSGIAGFTNNGLFATHHLLANVPERADWGHQCEAGTELLDKRGAQLIRALGFSVERGPVGSLMLSVNSAAARPRAVAVLLDESENFDTKSKHFPLSPVATGLAIAAREAVPWVLMLRRDQIRLYPGRDGVGVGAKGQTETYFEIDLACISPDHAAFLPLVFAAEALDEGGSTEDILADSARYATALGERLRDRIYEDVIPDLSVEVANQLASRAALTLDASGLTVAYKVTLHILFRLLFQAYAEDRGLLPSRRNEGFDANSLKTNAERLLAGEHDFGDAATIWFDLVQVWDAIDQGNPQWSIPAYNGGLFTTNPERSPEGALIAQLQLPDSTLGPVLTSLLIDESDDGGPGLVDFRSLSVREFGTIYEGLLESSLSVAAQDLTLDKNKAWVPAGPGDTIHAEEGTVYFHSASGERKATGSYFTPQIIVNHLVEQTIVPVLNEHLDKVSAHLADGDAPAAAALFFDFRVADLAMGSAHFLVAAIDKIESLMRTFLTNNDLPGVTEELEELANAAKEALGDDMVGKNEVDDIGLLRRQVARRCIYGLDVNPMAVELARLALWIHTFVPGLPMSNLDHNLVNANSLTGIGHITEAVDALQPGRKPGELTFFDTIIDDQLNVARDLLTEVANASEANKRHVERGAALLAKAQRSAETTRLIFNAAVAARLGEITVGAVYDLSALDKTLRQPAVDEAVDGLLPAHFPYLFPEVFVRDKAGFDVLLGNPPWEAPHTKEDRWWNLRYPGLITLPSDEKEERLAELRELRPDLHEEYEREVESDDVMRRALSTQKLPGVGSGHIDFYQAFAWRNWRLLRDGGSIGIVLPRSAHSGSGLRLWRKEVLDKGAFGAVTFIINKKRWAFNMEPRATIGITTIRKSHSNAVRFNGPFISELEFRNKVHTYSEVAVDKFRSWTDTTAFLMIPDATSVKVFESMQNSCPRFGSPSAPWRLRPTRGDLLAYKGLSRTGRHLIPIRQGKSFDLWDADAAESSTLVNEQEFRKKYFATLENSARKKRSAHYGQKYSIDDLPIDRARIAMRWISRAKDTRTCRAALLPPGCATDDSASVMLRLRGTARDEAFALGVLSSIPFDWQARLLTELNFTFEVLNQLAFPQLAVEESAVASRIADLAGRAAAVDERYADWADEAGVPVGTVASAEDLDEVVAEIDACVSVLYGLSERQVTHVFSTFHEGWDYAPRLNAVRGYFAKWKGER